jgi:hypothetical protein
MRGEGRRDEKKTKRSEKRRELTQLIALLHQFHFI